MGLSLSKFDYGTHETAIFKSGVEAESENQRKECKKDHSKYLSVDKVTLESLPEGYREPDLVDLITLMAALTARITVKYCTLNRKRYWMGTEAEYPCYSQRGTDISLNGSGRISDVFPGKKGELKCRCKKCKGQTSEEQDVWNIHVFTATHVVYDSEEAVSAQLKLFYDMNDGNKKVFYGVENIWSNDAGDLCLLSCVTCDKELADALLYTIKQFNIKWKQIRNNYKRDKAKASSKKDRMVVIVSHPHGGDKKISFDKLEGRQAKWIYFNRGWHLNYHASTCMGSSGAPVYLYGMDWFKSEYVHSGTNEENNFSTTWCP